MKRWSLLASLLAVLVLVAVVQFAGGAGSSVEAETIIAQEGDTGEPVMPEVPFLQEWMNSGHNNREAEAFIHWNEDDPAVVSKNCAKCHSTPGHQDFLGLDGTEAGVVDNDAPIGTTVECVACHNSVNLTKTSVVMPSGLEITGLGDESRCMECHQGRESKVSVDASIANAAVEDDAISEDLGFRNIHYFAAAATKYGTLAKGGYEYDGSAYDGNFAHVDGYDTCIGCHNPHTLELKIEECSGCHEGVVSAEDLHDVRMAGSLVDYDGDGDTEEGVYYELEGVRETLYAALQTYAETVLGAPVVYNPDAYPYFFADTDGNGEPSEGDERFSSWSPRLLKAAYNYQVSKKDPGAYAHGGKYIIQLMYDSIADLNVALEDAVDMSAMARIDAGHFAGSQEAFRHWDEEGAVPGSCAKCHSAGGLPMFLEEGKTISQPISNGFKCTTCHNDLSEFTRYEVASVTFPSGKTVDSGDQNMNLCMNCHQGRESGASVDRLIGDKADDEVSDGLRFLNIHYFAAGATRFGTEAGGGYEYADKRYVAFFNHKRDMNSCTDCHGAHSLEVKIEECAECHDYIEIETVEDLRDIRENFADLDGDGDGEEGLYYEIETLKEELAAALLAYSAETAGAAIGYNAHAYPYYFVDADGNGSIDEAETERYATWTPRLLRAAYNYQYASKDPGGFTHNGAYIAQLLIDSIEDLGGDVSAMERP